MPAYAKVVCNADGTITQKQYFDPNCRGAEADQATAIRELVEAELGSELQQDSGLPAGLYETFMQSMDGYIVFPDGVKDTFHNGECVTTAEIQLSKLTGNPVTTQASSPSTTTTTIITTT